jgi:hypothetical protein
MAEVGEHVIRCADCDAFVSADEDIQPDALAAALVHIGWYYNQNDKAWVCWKCRDWTDRILSGYSLLPAMSVRILG